MSSTETLVVAHLGLSAGGCWFSISYCHCYGPRWNAFERCSQFVFWFLFCEVAVGVGGSDEKDQSAPTQTAPQQVGFGSDRDDCGVDLGYLGTPTMMVWDEATHQLRAYMLRTSYLVPAQYGSITSFVTIEP